MSDTGVIRSKLAQLGERFLTRSHGELDSLRQHIERARGGDAKALEELHNLAHRMHGTGATLGFPDVGEQAAHIERLAEAQPCDFDGIAACMGRLEELIRARASERGVSL